MDPVQLYRTGTTVWQGGVALARQIRERKAKGNCTHIESLVRLWRPSRSRVLRILLFPGLQARGGPILDARQLTSLSTTAQKVPYTRRDKHKDQNRATCDSADNHTDADGIPVVELWCE
jgi:hypothetical protein